MTLLEAIKKAEEKQKTLGENTAKVYIRRKDWVNLLDPVDFGWNFGENTATPFKESSNEYIPNKSLLSNDWELFIHYYYYAPEAENKNNKETKPKLALIPKENITNSIEQIMLVKNLLKETLKNADLIVKVFQTQYGINFNDFVKKPELVTDKETRFLYLFTKLTMECIENVDGCLNKVIAELGNPEVDEKTE